MGSMTRESYLPTTAESGWADAHNLCELPGEIITLISPGNLLDDSRTAAPL